jgi:hypothetical protein
MIDSPMMLFLAAFLLHPVAPMWPKLVMIGALVAEIAIKAGCGG